MSPTPRVLVVDDELIVCQSVTKILQSKGYQVDAATDSRTGLDMVAKAQYVVILLDLKMPGMDGLELLGELRKRGHTTPVIVITGYPTIESAAAAMRLGAVDYVPKPFTPPEILAAVTRMIEATPIAKAPVMPAPAAPTPVAAMPSRPVAKGGTVAFTPPAGAVAAPPAAGKTPRWIKRVRITNRNGHQVSLVADQGLIEEHSGLGQALIKGILQEAFPLLVGLGSDPLTSGRIAAEEDSDRILVLSADNLGQQPGTAMRDRPVDAVQAAGAAAQKVTTITVQAPRTPAHGLCFGPAVDAALAGYLVKEMTA